MSDQLTTEEIYNLMDDKLDRVKDELLAALADSEKRSIERIDKMDTRINGRLKRGEDERTVLSKRMDAVEAWMRSKEIVSEFFVNKTKNPLVIFLLGIAITLGGTYFFNENKDTPAPVTSIGSSACELKLLNLKASLDSKLVTRDYYDIQFSKIKKGDC